MSQRDLADTYLRCELQQELAKKPYVEGTQVFVDMAIQMQTDEAVDELGDMLLEGPEAVDACLERSGVDIPADKAHRLFGGVVNCLANHYTGKCQASGTCTGRAQMQDRLDRLGIDEQQPHVADEATLADLMTEISGLIGWRQNRPHPDREPVA